MSDRILITVKGKAAIEEELRELKNVARPEVIAEIAEARSHGDLSENADYAAAKEKQAFIEGRIQELGDKIARSEVIDPSTLKSEKVVFGATVTVENDDGDSFVYQIVGEPEANIESGKLSLSAPLARALLGKEVGDEVQVQSPKGKVAYTIANLEYK
ncbi:MAG: transcription elongation factor GreA [Bdellovibrionota bacterium]